MCFKKKKLKIDQIDPATFSDVIFAKPRTIQGSSEQNLTRMAGVITEDHLGKPASKGGIAITHEQPKTGPCSCITRLFNNVEYEILETVLSATCDFAILSVLLAFNYYQSTSPKQQYLWPLFAICFWLLLVLSNACHFLFYLHYKMKKRQVASKRHVLWELQFSLIADKWFIVRSFFYTVVNQVGMYHISQMMWTDSSEAWFYSSKDTSNVFPIGTLNPCKTLFSAIEDALVAFFDITNDDAFIGITTIMGFYYQLVGWRFNIRKYVVQYMPYYKTVCIRVPEATSYSSSVVAEVVGVLMLFAYMLIPFAALKQGKVAFQSFVLWMLIVVGIGITVGGVMFTNDISTKLIGWTTGTYQIDYTIFGSTSIAVFAFGIIACIYLFTPTPLTRDASFGKLTDYIQMAIISVSLFVGIIILVFNAHPWPTFVPFDPLEFYHQQQDSMNNIKFGFYILGICFLLLLCCTFLAFVFTFTPSPIGETLPEKPQRVIKIVRLLTSQGMVLLVLAVILSSSLPSTSLPIKHVTFQQIVPSLNYTGNVTLVDSKYPAYAHLNKVEVAMFSVRSLKDFVKLFIVGLTDIVISMIQALLSGFKNAIGNTKICAPEVCIPGACAPFGGPCVGGGCTPGACTDIVGDALSSISNTENLKVWIKSQENAFVDMAFAMITSLNIDALNKFQSTIEGVVDMAAHELDSALFDFIHRLENLFDFLPILASYLPPLFIIVLGGCAILSNQIPVIFRFLYISLMASVFEFVIVVSGIYFAGQQFLATQNYKAVVTWDYNTLFFQFITVELALISSFMLYTFSSDEHVRFIILARIFLEKAKEKQVGLDEHNETLIKEKTTELVNKQKEVSKEVEAFNVLSNRVGANSTLKIEPSVK